jgi:uncharacterized membrane protein HdeD (DUF308 family)
MNFRLVSISDYWWVVLLRGIVTLLFGLAIFVWPGVTLALFIMLFATFAIVDGAIIAVHSLFAIGRDNRWWIKLLQGVAGIGAGIVAFLLPGLTALVLLYIIAFYNIFEGILQAVYGVTYRREARGSLILVASGIISVIFGVLLMLFPMTGALALIKVIGIFDVVLGLLLLLLAVDMLAARSSKPAAA